MYSEYAKDPRMKLNLGIRRRLAPLLDNDRRRDRAVPRPAVLAPGHARSCITATRSAWATTSILGDRDGVRTPMQWTPDRNGGFSSADFAQLYLPPLMDPVYGFAAVNVEAQLRNPGSFLHWVQRDGAGPSQHPVFATGTFEVLEPANPSVLAYLRRQARDGEPEDDRAVRLQPVEGGAAGRVELGQLNGKRPVELFGRVPFPLIGELPYFVTLPSYGFYWFSLVDQLGDDLRSATAAGSRRRYRDRRGNRESRRATGTLISAPA